MFCNKCNTLMRYVMRFEAGKSMQLYRCPICYFETRAVPLIFDKRTTQQNKKNIKKQDVQAPYKKAKKKVRIRSK